MEKFELAKQERDLESDRASFVEAVSTVSIEEITAIFDEQAVQELTGSIDKNKLFILGETHGVKENADVIYTLFKRFGFRRLALEWEPKLEGIIDSYLESGVFVLTEALVATGGMPEMQLWQRTFSTAFRICRPWWWRVISMQKPKQLLLMMSLTSSILWERM